jgi:hypothetical protein
VTTVTDLAKRLIGSDDEATLKSGDLAAICASPVLARRLARRLAEAAIEIAPGREWSVEDLRDLLEAAVVGKAEEARVLEGRQFRKRLRDQCALAERYGDKFACVILALAPEREPGAYASALDAVVERLRQSDMVFVYKRRLALILPRMRPEALPPLVERVSRLVSIGAGETWVEGIHTLLFPDPDIKETQEVLDWAEDHLRE